MAYRVLEDLHPAGRVVLLRADLNVPMKGGQVTDATRIERLVPTIEALDGRPAEVLLDGNVPLAEKKSDTPAFAEADRFRPSVTLARTV